MVRKEQHKDLVRNAERQQLLREAGLNESFNVASHRVVVGRLGDQLVKLGAKLQKYSATSQPENLIIKKA
jgi:hypothetical protein